MPDLLLKRDQVSRDQLFAMLYESRPESDWPESDKAAEAHLHKLRCKLKAIGFVVRTRWGRGWFLRPEDKPLIVAALGLPRYQNPVNAIDYALDCLDNHFDRLQFLTDWRRGAWQDWPDYRAWCERNHAR